MGKKNNVVNRVFRTRLKILALYLINSDLPDDYVTSVTNHFPLLFPGYWHKVEGHYAEELLIDNSTWDFIKDTMYFFNLSREEFHFLFNRINYNYPTSKTPMKVVGYCILTFLKRGIWKKKG